MQRSSIKLIKRIEEKIEAELLEAHKVDPQFEVRDVTDVSHDDSQAAEADYLKPPDNSLLFEASAAKQDSSGFLETLCSKRGKIIESHTKEPHGTMEK